MKKILLLLLVLSLFSCSYVDVKTEYIDRNIEKEIKVLQISDLHFKKEKALYENLINKINEINPDILLLTGDSVEEPEKLSLLADFLDQITIEGAKYAILGNWEHWGGLDLSELDRIYKDHGVHLLVNQSDVIRIKNQIFYIYGTDYITDLDYELENLEINDDNITLIMTHAPVYFDHLAAKYADSRLYVVSGHTHGGQITFFGKPLILPPGSGDYVKGIYRKNRSILFVSKGIGNSVHDFRLFASPDIYLLTFR